MTYRVIFHPLAEGDLNDIYDFISQDSPERGFSYIGRIQQQCLRLGDMPERGRRRDDLVPGIRTLVFERRAVIAYRLDPEMVTILRIFYAGQNIADAAWPVDP